MGSDLSSEYAYEPREGQPIFVSGLWSARWGARLAVGIGCAGLAFLALVKIDVHVSGQGVVLSTDQTDITASTSGRVDEVLVRPSQEVAEGTPIVRLSSKGEPDEANRQRTECEPQLVRLMFNPADASAREKLISCLTDKELAEARLQPRYIRSPGAGRISALWTNRGYQVAAGERVASLQTPHARFKLMGVIPGHNLPFVKPGAQLRFAFDGLPRVYRNLTIDWVAGEAGDSRAIGRYLGPGRGESSTTGPLLRLSAEVPERWFLDGGRRFDYAPGLTGDIRIRVRSERLIFVFAPALRYFFGS